MIKKRYISAIFLTSVISLMGTGFSSWLIGESPIDTTTGNITVDTDISFIDLKNTINYVIGSESGFEYYIYKSAFYFTETSFSLEIKINPYLMETTLSYSRLNLYFGISYATSSSTYDIFSINNSYTIPPVNAKYRLKNIPQFYLESDEVIVKKYNSDSKYHYSLESNIPLYGNENSLYAFASKYQKTNEDVYFVITYDFEVFDTFCKDISNYLNLDMGFYISVKGV